MTIFQDTGFHSQTRTPRKLWGSEKYGQRASPFYVELKCQNIHGYCFRKGLKGLMEDTSLNYVHKIAYDAPLLKP